MLFGEHAVLQGYPALCMAISHRLTVQLQPNDTKTVNITSALGNYQEALGARLPASFKFLNACLETVRGDLSYGLNITITSDFSDKIGFGSSAAITITSLAGLKTLLGIEVIPHTLFIEARQVIQAVQGHGSGCDAAASLYGGVVYFQPNTLEIEKIPFDHPITVVNCGYKTPTSEVIKVVMGLSQSNPTLYQRLYKEIGEVSTKARKTLLQGDISSLQKLFRQSQILQNQLGVNTPELQEIIDFLEKQPTICGAKISGSGLGDCVIGLGTIAKTQQALDFFKKYTAYATTITEQGLTIAQS